MLLMLFSDVMALFICWLFITSGIHKLNPNNKVYYTKVMQTYGISQKYYAYFTMVTLGVIELIISAVVLIPSSRIWGGIISITLFMFYFLVMAYQIYRGKKNISCGCSGPSSELKITPSVLSRNLLLSLAALFCLHSGTETFNSSTSIVLVLTVIVVVFYNCSEQLFVNRQYINRIRN